MDQLLQLLVNGLAVGSVYALIALAFIIVYESTGVVNFATGQFVMVGCFLGVATVIQAGLPLGAAYFAALLAMAAFGVAFYALVYRPLQDRAIVTVIIGTVAVGIFIQNAALLTWGSLPVRLPSPFGTATLALGRTVLTQHALFVIVVTAVLIAALYLLLYRTPVGSRMRAVAQDREAARLMGIRVNRLFALSWVIAGLLTGVAGLLLGPMWFADVNMGDPLALKAFAATIIGGFGSVPGAIVGGLFVGLAEMLGAAYVSSAYKDGLVFLLMVLFLLLRPQGIFGERIGQRG